MTTRPRIGPEQNKNHELRDTRTQIIISCISEGWSEAWVSQNLKQALRYSRWASQTVAYATKPQDHTLLWFPHKQVGLLQEHQYLMTWISVNGISGTIILNPKCQGKEKWEESSWWILFFKGPLASIQFFMLKRLCVLRNELTTPNPYRPWAGICFCF